jgi:uncharacterized protein (TIGR03000 family)
MYSVVLMAALTTGSSAPDWHWPCGSHGASYGCYGGWGGYGYWGSGCYGCYGCTGCTGYSRGGYSLDWLALVSPGTEKAPAPKKVGGKEALAPGNAKLIIDVPEDAKLYIDDQLMKTSSSKRTFDTPALERGHTYYYIVRAEVVMDGQSYSETKRVLVRAGDQIQARFPELESKLSLAKR